MSCRNKLFQVVDAALRQLSLRAKEIIKDAISSQSLIRCKRLKAVGAFGKYAIKTLLNFALKISVNEFD